MIRPEDLGVLAGIIGSVAIFAGLIKIWWRLMPEGKPTVERQKVCYCQRCSSMLAFEVDRLAYFKSMYLQGHRVRPVLVMAWRAVK